MTDKATEIISKLREHAEWARANEWETPITLSDDLEEAAKALMEAIDKCEVLEKYIEIAVIESPCKVCENYDDDIGDCWYYSETCYLYGAKARYEEYRDSHFRCRR